MAPTDFYFYARDLIVIGQQHSRHSFKDLLQLCVWAANNQTNKQKKIVIDLPAYGAKSVSIASDFVRFEMSSGNAIYRF